METAKKNVWLTLGTVAAAFGASLCCILPIAVAVLGVGSAAMGAKLEPLRPYLSLLTVAFLSFAFYRAYRPQEVECAPGESCAVPDNRRRQRLILWLVAAIALLLLAFPYYAGLLF